MLESLREVACMPRVIDFTSDPQSPVLGWVPASVVSLCWSISLAILTFTMEVPFLVQRNAALGQQLLQLPVRQNPFFLPTPTLLCQDRDHAAWVGAHGIRFSGLKKRSLKCCVWGVKVFLVV